MELKTPKKVKAFAYLNPFRKQLVRYAFVPSQSFKGRDYAVNKLQNFLGTKYTCECRGYYYHQKDCKHIKAFKAEELAKT